MKPLFVVNPRSGGGRTGRAFPEIRRVIERTLGEIDVCMTERMGHASEIAERASKDGRETIVAVGGDGTLSECTDGVLRARAGDAVRLGLVGQGTGGDFRKTAGFEHRLDAYVRALAEGRERRIDAGAARFPGHDGKPRERFFINILSAGMGGLVDHHVARASQTFGGTAAYFIASARALFEIVPGIVRCEITSAGRTREEQISTYMIAICNGRYFGAGMHVAPMAKIDDGVLEVVSMNAQSKLAFAVHSRAIYQGKHLQREGVRHFRCERIRIELLNQNAKKTFLLDVDGEPLGAMPVEVEVRKGALRLIAPA
jgi:YegS/Rv2252/BmrU family lipid kinase